MVDRSSLRRIAPPPATGGTRILAASRYRDPGDVLTLIGGGLALCVAVVVLAIGPGPLVGSDAAVVRAGSDLTKVLVGLMQVVAVAATAGVVIAVLAQRRYRLLAGVAIGALVAAAIQTALVHLFGVDGPSALAAARASDSWLTGAAFPDSAFSAGATAVTLILTNWLSRPWRRAVWVALLTFVVALLVAGTALPMEMVLALAVGVTVGAGLLVLFGVPDRRIGPAGVAAALEAGGLPVASVVPADIATKGSRPFLAITAGGRRLFVKVVGRDQRHADLLYRAYRFMRLRGVDDTRPAASLMQAVEHQALVGVMAERAGVHVPSVDRLVESADGSAVLAMELVTGASLERLPAADITDDLLRELWGEVDRLHQARIAHRGLRAANVMVDATGRPCLTDFSFAELTATDRQIALDVAELMASLAALVGPERAVGGALAAIGPDGVAPAVSLLQPLALSAATRHDVAGKEKLLKRTRSAAAEASGRPAGELARLQRVRPRTLLTIAALAGAFYFLLPQLAQVGTGWQALKSAEWAWLPLVIAMSALTYLGSAIGLMGAVRERLPFGPTLLSQVASSFINRVSPANVGGMALNARYLQRCGVEPATAVTAIGLNSLAGGLMHLVLIVVFFSWAGSNLSQAFSLPSGSKLLAVLAVLAAVVGVALATRWGRRVVIRKLLRGLVSSAANLRQVATNPVRLTMLFGGSAVVTLAYIAALAASIEAFGGGVGVAEVGAVYLGAATVAAAAPTPGGLGAIEAALVAGLTGVGMEPGPAVSAVLTYRLATYWLPVLPGWLSWRVLQRREYV
jgi:undecaprenyl-diphosphatase